MADQYGEGGAWPAGRRGIGPLPADPLQAASSSLAPVKLSATHWGCPYCRYTGSQSNTRRHMRSCHPDSSGLRRQPCDSCGKVFYSAEGLRSHKVRYHGVAGRRTCSICGQTFWNLDHFESHVNRHLHLEPFACSYCGKSFNNKSNRRRHEKVCMTRHQGPGHESLGQESLGQLAQGSLPEDLPTAQAEGSGQGDSAHAEATAPETAVKEEPPETV